MHSGTISRVRSTIREAGQIRHSHILLQLIIWSPPTPNTDTPMKTSAVSVQAASGQAQDTIPHQLIATVAVSVRDFCVQTVAANVWAETVYLVAE